MDHARWQDSLRGRGLRRALAHRRRGLADLPAFALPGWGLVQIRVSDCAFECKEHTHLVWRPAAAAGWQARLVDAMRLPDAA